MPACSATKAVPGSGGGTCAACPLTSATPPPRKSRCSAVTVTPSRGASRSGARPSTITFAHTLPTSRLPEGDLPGDTVAVYRVHFADGETQDIPIRERFEIGVSPDMTDRFRVGAPFLALPHVDVPPRRGMRSAEAEWAAR